MWKLRQKLKLVKGWYTYDVHENCPIFKTPNPPCPSTSKIRPPPWPWTSNFKRTPLPLQMITSQLKEKRIQWWILSVIRSFLQVGFRFSINSLILPGFPLTSFHLAEASLSAFSWLYTLVCTVVNCVQLFAF